MLESHDVDVDRLIRFFKRIKLDNIIRLLEALKSAKDSGGTIRIRGEIEGFDSEDPLVWIEEKAKKFGTFSQKDRNTINSICGKILRGINIEVTIRCSPNNNIRTPPIPSGDIIH